MGNMIGSVDEDFNSLRYSHLKAKGLTHTAMGRYTTPNLKKRSAQDLIRVKTDKNKDKKENNDFNSNIYKDIFPPPNNTTRTSRNTMSPVYFEKHLNKSDNIGIENILIQETRENSQKNETLSSPNKQSEIKYDEILLKKDDINLQQRKESDESGKISLNEEINSLSQENLKNSKDAELDMYDLTLNRSQSLTSPTNANNFSGNEYELKIFKTGEDIRRSYIAKLIYKKIWQPNLKVKDHNSLIIFDWDDTLLCTSFLTPNGVFSEDTKISEKEMEKIKKLESASASILKKAIQKGETYIITNAAPGWVEYSANRFYPEVAKLLGEVTIVSARGEYEKKFPGDSRQWKILAFLETLKNLDNSLVTNLICLGDSVIEMEAAHILASKFTQAYIKTIKFREAPKPEELNKQLGLVNDQFDKIFSAIKNLTIRVEKKSKDESTNQTQNTATTANITKGK
jgi:hypothetical protein